MKAKKMTGREAKGAKKRAEGDEKVRPAREKAKKVEKVKLAKKKAVEPTEGIELYRGMVALSILPPIYPGQLDSLKRALLKVEDLRVVMVGGAVDEGSRVLVSAEEPLPLLNILRIIPVVEEVVVKGGEIQLRLKAS